MDLMGRDTLLACHHKVHGKKPFVQRDFGTFHGGPNGHAERFSALITFVDAGARALASELCNAAGIGIAAMTASRAIRPMELFEMLSGFIGIGENWVCEIAHKIALPMKTILRYAAWYVN
jgi:hypothetical protein